jgi:hypothetical protein
METNGHLTDFETWHNVIVRLKEERKVFETRIGDLLRKSEEQLKSVRKRHNAGVAHESHLSYAEGLRDGLQSAMDALNCPT